MSPDLFSSVDGYMATVVSLLSATLFLVGFCWLYGYDRLMIDFIFWYDPKHPTITKAIVIGSASIVAPITLLVRVFDYLLLV